MGPLHFLKVIVFTVNMNPRYSDRFTAGVTWATGAAVSNGENNWTKEMAEAMGAFICDGEQTQTNGCMYI